MRHTIEQPYLGLSSYAFRWGFGFGDFVPRVNMTAEMLIQAAAEERLNAVQICDNVPFLDYPPERLHVVRSLADERGIRIETGVRGTDPAILERALLCSRTLDSKLLRVVVEIERSGAESVTDQLESAAARIRRTAETAGEQGILIAVENHATVTAPELRFLIESVHSEACGACLDTMNSVLLLEKPEDTVRILAPVTFSVHLKDFRIAKLPDCYRIDGTALGEGLLDLPAIMAELRRSGNPRSFHAELYIERRGSEEETLRRERDCVRRSAEVLRDLFP